MKKYLSIFILVFFSGTGLYSQSGGSSNKEQWQYINDSVYHFTIAYPTSWTLKQPGTNTRFFFTSPLETANDIFRENLNCIARKLDIPGFSVFTAEQTIKERLNESIKDFKLISTLKSKWFGADALELIYTRTSESDGVKYLLKIYQKIAAIGDVMYTFTYTAEEKQYTVFDPTIKKIMESFKPAGY
jgi:hypothetical protein